jgi:hypothetical protein
MTPHELCLIEYVPLFDEFRTNVEELSIRSWFLVRGERGEVSVELGCEEGRERRGRFEEDLEDWNESRGSWRVDQQRDARGRQVVHSSAIRVDLEGVCTDKVSSE